DIARAREAPLPEFIANHGNGIRVAQLVHFLRERVAENRIHAQHRKIRPAHQLHVGGRNALSRTLRRNGSCETGCRENAGEHGIVARDVLKFRIRQNIAHAVVKADSAALLVRIGEKNKLLWMCYRQIVEQNRVDHGENRGVCADAERESEDGDGGKSRRSDEHSHAVTQILPESRHGHTPPPVSYYLRRFDSVTGSDVNGNKINSLDRRASNLRDRICAITEDDVAETNS